MLAELANGTGLTKGEFLTEMKFPDAAAAPGPSVRSGDFAEIIVADYIEYKLGYWCPRKLRYEFKWNRNESTKGCDIVGFKFVQDGAVSPQDELFVFEAKAQLAPGAPQNRLQVAIDDSNKDKLREGMTLNALKQRFLERGERAPATKIERFQNETDRPFKRISGAAAVHDIETFDPVQASTVTTAAHFNGPNLKLIVVMGPAMMQLVHALYQRAVDEA
ncbi:Hachiman antiphage defense system protein HamA [Bradyrhizobium sp. RDT46]|uniref:Hachiman antiphage defense system protein HamA n=1 Tax=Bradyrhizobium sp. RDT46 TaxID=3341829 RepID=UPI0035C6EE60